VSCPRLRSIPASARQARSSRISQANRPNPEPLQSQSRLTKLSLKMAVAQEQPSQSNNSTGLCVDAVVDSDIKTGWLLVLVSSGRRLQ
jgi:hypothetical protein